MSEHLTDSVVLGEVEYMDLMSKVEKLEVVYRMLEKWEQTTTHPESTIINIRNLKQVIEKTWGDKSVE